MACVAVHKWRHEPERILEALKKAPGRSANSAPLYPTGPVKWIPLRGKTEGVPLMLVYYVQEGDVQEGESPSPAYAEVDVKGWDLKNLGEKDV